MRADRPVLRDRDLEFISEERGEDRPRGLGRLAPGLDEQATLLLRAADEACDLGHRGGGIDDLVRRLEREAGEPPLEEPVHDEVDEGGGKLPVGLDAEPVPPFMQHLIRFSVRMLRGDVAGEPRDAAPADRLLRAGQLAREHPRFEGLVEGEPLVDLLEPLRRPDLLHERVVGVVDEPRGVRITAAAHTSQQLPVDARFPRVPDRQQQGAAGLARLGGEFDVHPPSGHARRDDDDAGPSRPLEDLLVRDRLAGDRAHGASLRQHPAQAVGQFVRLVDRVESDQDGAPGDVFFHLLRDPGVDPILRAGELVGQLAVVARHAGRDARRQQSEQQHVVE